MKPAPYLIAIALISCLSVAHAADWPQWGGVQARNMASPAKDLPDFFQPGFVATDTQPAVDPVNIKWSSQLGTETYGNPTICGGKVFIGTNNGHARNPLRPGDRAVLMCFSEADGRFLWQLAAPKRQQSGKFNGDYPNLGLCSSPTVDGNRVYVVTSRCEVLCLDVNGLANGNDGPFVDEAQYLAKPRSEKIVAGPDGPDITVVPSPPVTLAPDDADITWMFDMMREVKSWPQDASSCSVLIFGNYLYVGTSNGVDSTHKHIPCSQSPSFIVLDKHTGKLIATDDAGISPNVFHGQWSSPALGVVRGKPLIFYGAGDGFCYAFDPKPAPGAIGAPGILKTRWRFDCNPPERRFRNGKQLLYGANGDGPSEVTATPVFYKNRIYVAVGQDPRHGKGRGCLSCIDATGTGDISATGAIWRYMDIGRTLSTVSIADGLLYVADFSGILRCLDADTGQVLWTHDTGSPIWGSTFVADGKVYLGTERGQLWVLKAGREKQILNTIEMHSPVYTTPVVANGVLYVTSQRRLYAVQKPRQ